jgi:hypothetical protein
MENRIDLFEKSPIKADISLDSSNVHSGGFKQATFGTVTTSPAIFSSGPNVCAKQTFYRKEGSTAIITHASIDQLSGLSNEANCLAWAAALVFLVDDFIHDFLPTASDITKSAPPTLKLRFVDAGIAIEQGRGKVHLVEERIPGKFVKFIHNRSASVPRLRREEDVTLALYLSFTQHVQYIRTGKLAFVSDYQGTSIFLIFRT